MSDGAQPEALPETIGVVGVGTIGSAVVRGLCTTKPGVLSRLPSFVLSPRGAAKAAALKEEFGQVVRIAASNQEVVDAADCVIVSVLPRQADEVLSALTFRPGQRVISLIPTVGLARLKELAAPASECAVAMPLPAVARQSGATLLIPSAPFVQAIFAPLGSCVAVEDEAQFRRMMCITCLMGDFYKRQLVAQEWLESFGVPQDRAAAWTGASFATMAADSSAAGPHTLAELVAEQTPGGLNEMVWRGQEEDGGYAALRCSLDSVHHRIATGKIDPALTPAAKRAQS